MQHKNVIATGMHQLMAGSSLLGSQITTLTVCVLGLMAGHRLSLASIGKYMPGRALVKHKIKRVDRWCGNSLVDVDPITKVMLVALGKRTGSLLVSVDWTKIDDF